MKKKLMLMCLVVALALVGSVQAAAYTSITEGWTPTESAWELIDQLGTPEVSSDTGYLWSGNQGSSWGMAMYEYSDPDSTGLLLSAWNLFGDGANAWATFNGDTVTNLASIAVEVDAASYAQSPVSILEMVICDNNGDWFVSDQHLGVVPGSTQVLNALSATWRAIDPPEYATKIFPGAVGTPDLSSVSGGGVNYHSAAGLTGNIDLETITYSDAVVGTALIPSPANGTTGLPDAQTITWTAVLDANTVSIDAYDVYFGDSLALVTAGDASVKVGTQQALAAYTVGTLIIDTPYYLRVDPNTTVDDSAIPVSIAGSVWTYTGQLSGPAVHTTLTEEFDYALDGDHWFNESSIVSASTGFTWSGAGGGWGMFLRKDASTDAIALNSYGTEVWGNIWTTFPNGDSVANAAAIEFVMDPASTNGNAVVRAMVQDANGDWFLSNTIATLSVGVRHIDLTLATWDEITVAYGGQHTVTSEDTGTPDLTSVLGVGIHSFGVGGAANVLFDSLTLTDVIPLAGTLTPANGAVDVPIAADNLSWDVPDGVLSTVRFGTDPNMADPIDPDNSDLLVASLDETVGYAELEYYTTYYWQITTDDGGAIEVSDTFSFTTVSAVPVIAEFDNVRTALDLLPADLTSLVTDNDDNINGVSWTLLSDDFSYPAGAIASVTADSLFDFNSPLTTTASFTTDTSGWYVVQVGVTDGGGNSVTRNAAVQVFETTCELAIAQGEEFNEADVDENCDVDIADFAFIAEAWLDDINATSQDSVPVL